MRRTVVAVVGVGLAVFGIVGCSGDDDTSADVTSPAFIRASPDKTQRLLQLAVEAANAEDRDQLCALGVTVTCEGTLARLATVGLAWPSTAPRTVWQGRFGDDRDQGGYAITVCVGDGDDVRITDFAIYDGVGGHEIELRDPVYWSGDRLEPVVEAGAPTTCD